MGEESDDDDRGEEGQPNVHEETPAFCRAALEQEYVYESLGHVRRRYLCYLLCGRSELQVDDVVAAIAQWETDDRAETQASTRNRIRLSLLHSHIPKLRANDVVDFDRHSGTLVRGENADAVLAALEAAGTALTPERPNPDDCNEAG